jgi:hypothetical protein
MEIISLLPTILAFTGVAFAAFAAFKAIESLKYRLYIEKKLAHKLAISLAKRKIDSKISVRLNKITIEGKCTNKQIDLFKKEIDSALKEAIQELVDSERSLVLQSIEQPSKKGQFNYLKKLVETSLDELQHKQA